MAQVLKRNRTLKVLNLSENKLDVQALVAIAEALVRLFSQITSRLILTDILQKYNSTLETLDLSKNPCSGPDLEGVCWPGNSLTSSANSLCRSSLYGPHLPLILLLSDCSFPPLT